MMYITIMYSSTSVQELNMFWEFGRDDHACVCVGMMATSVFVQFANKNKILPTASACEPNCLETNAFINQGTTVLPYYPINFIWKYFIF